MPFSRVVGAACALALLSGCGPLEAREAKEAVRDQLVDPNSAQFTDMRTLADGRICGWVNAKNSMGGYTGRRPFVYFAGQAWFPADTSELESKAARLWERMGTFGVSRSEYNEMGREREVALEDIAILEEMTTSMFGGCPYE